MFHKLLHNPYTLGVTTYTWVATHSPQQACTEGSEHPSPLSDT